MRPVTVQTKRGHTQAVSPEHPSTKHARHAMTITKMHAAARARTPEIRASLSKKQREAYDRVVNPKQSAANAELNATLRAGGTDLRSAVTSQQGAALQQQGSKTY